MRALGRGLGPGRASKFRAPHRIAGGGYLVPVIPSQPTSGTWDNGGEREGEKGFESSPEEMGGI